MQQDDMLARIRQAQAGDREAFARLVAEHYDMIYRVAYKWSGSQTDAEDVAQEVCARLGSAIQSFRAESAFSSWLYRVTLNCLRDMQRGRQRRAEQDGEAIAETVADPAQDPEADSMRQDLWRKVQQLPEKQRTAILLVYAEELSHRQAAEIMECSENTVSWHVHEARKTLKAMV